MAEMEEGIQGHLLEPLGCTCSGCVPQGVRCRTAKALRGGLWESPRLGPGVYGYVCLEYLDCFCRNGITIKAKARYPRAGWKFGVIWM